MATSRKRASGASTFDKIQLSEADISQTDRGWSLSFNYDKCQMHTSTFKYM